MLQTLKYHVLGILAGAATIFVVSLFHSDRSATTVDGSYPYVFQVVGTDNITGSVRLSFTRAMDRDTITAWGYDTATLCDFNAHPLTNAHAKAISEILKRAGIEKAVGVYEIADKVATLQAQGTDIETMLEKTCARSPEALGDVLYLVKSVKAFKELRAEGVQPSVIAYSHAQSQIGEIVN